MLNYIETMVFTEKEETKMTKFLIEFLENADLRASQADFFAEKFKCEHSEALFLLRSIFEINEFFSLQIFVTEKFKDDTYEIVSINEYKCSRFINQGGFAKLFFDNSNMKPKDGNNLTIHNSGAIGSINQSSGDNSPNYNKTKIINHSAENDKNKIKALLSKYWWKVAIPTILLGIGLLIEKCFFKK